MSTVITSEELVLLLFMLLLLRNIKNRLHKWKTCVRPKRMFISEKSNSQKKNSPFRFFSLLCFFFCALSRFLWRKMTDRYHALFSVINIFNCHMSFIFTALHVMQTRYSEENSVCPSVCLSVRPSVRHTRDPWQNGRKICPDFNNIRKNIYSSFLRRRMVGGGRPLLREILGQPTPLERNRRFSTNNRS